jgi:cell division septation protein DedD
MKLLASAVVVLGMAVATPAHASGDVAADRHLALAAQHDRFAATPAEAPTSTSRDADRAPPCACARTTSSTRTPAR